MELADWKEKADAGFLDLRRTRLRVITADITSCPACRALEGRVFTYDQTLRLMPVPNEGMQPMRKQPRPR